MKRKALLMALAVLLVLTVFAGCGQTSQGSGSSLAPGSDQGSGNSQGSGIDQQVSAQLQPATADQNGQSFITAQQAQEIALNHAGKTADQVRFMEVDSDLYDFRPHYDVEFVFENVEYEYEIDAVTGEILKAETDR